MISQLEVLMNQEYKLSPNKIREISWYGYFLEAHSLRRVSGDLLKSPAETVHTTKLGQISIFLCVFNIVHNEWVTKIDKTLQTFVKTNRRQSLKATDFGKHIADKNEIGTFHPVNILDIIS